jgi:hypothetical protein
MTILIARPFGIKSTPLPRRPRRRPNPRSSWPAWTDQVVVSIVPEPAEPRPTAEPDYTPSPAAVIWNDAYAIGYDHDASAVPPSEMPEGLALSWWHGRNSGWLARDRDDAQARRIDAPRRTNNLTDSDVWPNGVC